MRRGPIPLIILGGSDIVPARLPEGTRGRHSLGGYKAISLRIAGRPLILHLTERLRRTKAFAPIYVAGPASIYRKVEPSVPVIDTDGSLGANLRAGVDTVRRSGFKGPIAFVAYDILPNPEDVQRLLDDYTRGSPSDAWFPLTPLPDTAGKLGASDWKPRYWIRLRPEEPPIGVLPGHLVIVNPEALRLPLVYRLLDALYLTRNRSIAARRFTVMHQILWALLREELGALLHLRIPRLTYRVCRHAIPTAARLSEGKATLRELEDTLDSLVVRPEYRGKHPEAGLRMPVINALSFARDIDTEEEAREVGARLDVQEASSEEPGDSGQASSRDHSSPPSRRASRRRRRFWPPVCHPE